MKRILLLLVLVSVTFTACSKKQEVQNSDNVQKSNITEEKKEDKKTEDKKDEDTKEDKVKTQETTSYNNVKNVQKKQVSGIYYKENLTLFDKTIDSNAISEYVYNNKLSITENTPITISIEDNNIKSIEPVSEISVQGKYVGLADSNTAQFDYNGTSFTLKIDDSSMNKLEEIGEDVLLSLLVKKDEDGLKLVEIKNN